MIGNLFGVVAGDVQIITGHNVRLLRIETSLDPTSVSSAAMKQVLVRGIQAVPDRDKWRLGYLGSMLQTRGEAYYAGKDVELLTSLIDSLCSS